MYDGRNIFTIEIMMNEMFCHAGSRSLPDCVIQAGMINHKIKIIEFTLREPQGDIAVYKESSRFK